MILLLLFFSFSFRLVRCMIDLFSFSSSSSFLFISISMFSKFRGWLRPGFLDFFACWRFRQFSVRVKIFFLIFVLVVRWFVDFEGFFFYGFDLWVGLNVSFIVGWWPWNGFRFRWKRWLGLVIELWRLGICSGWESGYLRFVSNVQILIFF